MDGSCKLNMVLHVFEVVWCIFCSSETRQEETLSIATEFHGFQAPTQSPPPLPRCEAGIAQARESCVESTQITESGPVIVFSHRFSSWERRRW